MNWDLFLFSSFLFSINHFSNKASTEPYDDDESCKVSEGPHLRCFQLLIFLSSVVFAQPVKSNSEIMRRSLNKSENLQLFLVQMFRTKIPIQKGFAFIGNSERFNWENKYLQLERIDCGLIPFNVRVCLKFATFSLLCINI